MSLFRNINAYNPHTIHIILGTISCWYSFERKFYADSKYVTLISLPLTSAK